MSPASHLLRSTWWAATSPSWPTSYCQETMLLYKYFGDDSVMRDRFESIKRYVDFLRKSPSQSAATAVPCDV